MELFTEDSSYIEKDINYLKNQLHHGYNLSSKSSIIYSLQTLDCLSYLLNAKPEIIKKTNKNKSIVTRINERDNAMHNKKIDNFINYKDEYLDFASAIFNEDKDISIPIYDDCFEDDFLSDKAMYEIICDFFLKTNNLEALKIFKVLVEENKMHLINSCGSSYKGITFLNTFMNDFRIVIDISSIDNSIDLMTTIVHEIGHVMDYRELGNDNVYYRSKSLFVETLSSLYEKNFMDFLINNSIYKRKTTTILTDYYTSMYDDINNIILAGSIPDDLIRKEKYKKMDREKLYEKIAENTEILVDIEDFPVPQFLDLIDSLEYGYGKALATYFSKLEKINKEKYDEQFNKFLELRKSYYPKNFLSKMGTTSEYVQDLIDDEISSSPCKIIIKK